MTIIESSVWIDYINGLTTPETKWLDRELPSRRIGLTDLILTEVLQGMQTEHKFRHVRGQLLALPVFHSGGQRVALAAAQNHRLLRAKGITIRGVLDCMTATFCILEQHALLHHDCDFDGFERHLGLMVVHP